MSLLNQNKKGKKDDKKKSGAKPASGSSKFIAKAQNNVFVSKQMNTGSQRGS